MLKGPSRIGLITALLGAGLSGLIPRIADQKPHKPRRLQPVRSPGEDERLINAAEVKRQRKREKLARDTLRAAKH